MVANDPATDVSASARVATVLVKRWGREGSNLRQTDYESAALTAELRPRGQSTRVAACGAQGSSR
jgi:hypothetical protein